MSGTVGLPVGNEGTESAKRVNLIKFCLFSLVTAIFPHIFDSLPPAGWIVFSSLCIFAHSVLQPVGGFL